MRYSRLISVAMASVVALSVAFALGIEVGANAQTATGITAAIVAANAR